VARGRAVPAATSDTASIEIMRELLQIE